jgi:hypothetical protein
MNKFKDQLYSLLKQNSNIMLFLYNGLYEQVTAGIQTPISRKEVIDLLTEWPETKIYMFVVDERKWSWESLKFEGALPEKSIPDFLKQYNVQVNTTDSEETIQLLMGIKIGISINSVTYNY